MEIQAQYFSQNLGISPRDMLMESGFSLNNLSLAIQNQQEFDQKNIQIAVENNNSNNEIFHGNNVNHHLYRHQQQAMEFSRSFSAHIEKQRIEFEQFINSQKDRLRLGVQQQRKHQISVLLTKFESRTRSALEQKEGEIARASGKTMELQNLLKKLEDENLTWHRIAMENQSMAASLSGTIQRLRESAAPVSAADDAASCCQDGDTPLEARAGAAAAMGICRSCGSRNSRVVILPCRHLCSCVECEAFLDTCPVCRTAKSGGIEALI